MGEDGWENGLGGGKTVRYQERTVGVRTDVRKVFCMGVRRISTSN